MHTLRWMLSVLLLVTSGAVSALQLLTEDDPPHNMLKDGKIVGIATEKLEEAFKRVGSLDGIQLMPWARAYQSALHEPGSCVYSAARTPERETLFKWVGPIAAMDWVLYARADLKVKPAKLEDLRKEIIGGYLQDVISVWLADQGYKVETVSNDGANPKKLLVGRINYWASSKPRATILLAKENAVGRIVPILTFGHTDLYLACNKATPDHAVQMLNEALRAMEQDGTAAKIVERYVHWPAE